jgi:DNA-binding FadR family transcriptional regulator
VQIKEIESWASYEYYPGQKNSYYTFLEWNRSFHISIAAASRNSAFLDVVRNEQTRLMRYFYQVIVMDSYGHELIMEHQNLVRAIKARNPDLARARAVEHLTNTSRRSTNVDLRSVNYSAESLLGSVEADRLQRQPSRTPRAKRLQPVARRATSLPQR